MWALQGIVLGDTHANLTGTFSSNFFRNNATMSMTISQDTLVSAVLDGGSWLVPEPNLATLVSEVGVGYDLLRNPLSPYLSSAPPVIPNVIAPTYSASVDFSSPIPIYSGWSLFPSP